MITTFVRTALGAGFVLALAAPALAVPAVLTRPSPLLDGPGKEYTTLATLAEGTHLDVIWCGTKGNWCLVDRRGRKGWVALDLLNLKLGARNLADVGGSTGNPAGLPGAGKLPADSQAPPASRMPQPSDNGDLVLHTPPHAIVIH